MIEESSSDKNKKIVEKKQGSIPCISNGKRVYFHHAMTKSDLLQLLRAYKLNKITPDEVIEKLSSVGTESIGFAAIDHHRPLRQGFPEVILCERKTPAQVAEIAHRIGKRGEPLLATRANADHYRAVKRKVRGAHYHDVARTITANEPKTPSGSRGVILVISAGTSDIPIAEEAAITARVMGNRVETIFDVGVAGIHRLLAHNKSLREASVIIVVAGMEGALPSVVGGLVDVPVIAVPTSVGYGSSFHGVAALLAMLNSCASGITVVNIDNGFGAGYAASLMNRMRS